MTTTPPQMTHEIDWDKLHSFEDYKQALMVIDFNILVDGSTIDPETLEKYFKPTEVVLNLPDAHDGWPSEDDIWP